jgi:hypothetical protein
MPKPFDIPSNLSPDRLAGHLDQASLAVVDSEGPVLGPRPAGDEVDAPALDAATHALVDLGRPPAPSRRRLPDRRQTICLDIVHDGVRYAVDFGLHPQDGKVSEIFVAGPSDADHDDALLQDLAAIVSLALQSGITAEALLGIVGRRSAEPGAEAFASVIGATLEQAAKINREPKLL